MRDAHTSADLPAPAGGYSHVAGRAGVYATAGFGPQDPTTGEVADDIGAQTHQVLANVRTALQLAGLTLDDVIKVTVHLQHLERDFAGFDAAYRAWFAEPRPARTTVGSALMGILVEIDVLAIAPDAPAGTRPEA